MALRNTGKLANPVLDQLAKAVGSENITGTQITRCLKELRLSDTSKESTKWKRLAAIFKKYQKSTGTSAKTFAIIENLMNPVNFLDKTEAYHDQLSEINKVLRMQGYEIDVSGQIKRAPKITSIDEVSDRYDSLLQKLKQRGVHQEVLKYCTKELLAENYFHGVLEAAKSLSSRARELSGIDKDGTALFDTVFSTKTPVLQLNDLSTESQRNQQNGLREMLNGITHYVRNVNAHEPRIKWIVDEQEAIHILETISFLHRMLDNCTTISE